MDPVERYLAELAHLRRAGAGVDELSGYPALKNLLDEIGSKTKPKVRTIMSLRNLGAGLPDGGLFTGSQFTRGSAAEPKDPSRPDVAAIEVKGTADDLNATIASDQVNKYLARYGQVLVTNYRQFILMVERNGGALKADEFSLADDEATFWDDIAAQPRLWAAGRGYRLTEFLTRVLRSRARLTEPSDVAWMLASHARDALETLGGRQLRSLDTIRTSFEEALGITFEGANGDHFFRSSLVQTLFYGIFSGWVLWSRRNPAPDAVFDWKDAGWTLHVPMISALFDQIATRRVLGDLQLIAVLDRTGDVLNRVDRAAFFEKFQEQEAVQYFYEPFLQAFDPDLRKQLGVWYTPREVVQYMVARVDTVLREELKLPLGLADPNVVVLDPCCGTGAYLVEVLSRIETTLREQGGDALVASDLRKAAMERVFGFEILPAPFVVAHLQLGLLLQQLGAPLPDKPDARVGVYLTNALTGWNPDTKHPDLPFRELADERDRAGEVKQSKPILVILGNPPYNGFAGVTPSEEERELTVAYRKTKRAPAPQGQGLNDLYVRFFRMAERKIVEQTGKGIVCFISNYSWLDGLSFTGMRERYLEVFDKIWIDCLNGDKYKTGKLTPEGEPDPSIFSTKSNREGIQVGTAIAMLARLDPHAQTSSFLHRDLWGAGKRVQLDVEAKRPNLVYERLEAEVGLGLTFHPTHSGHGYTEWPQLPLLFPTYFPGVKTSRDEFLVSIDKASLEARIADYFDPTLPDSEIRHRYSEIIPESAKYSAEEWRARLRESEVRNGSIVHYAYRPFDVRWLYYTPAPGLLDRPRHDYFTNCEVQGWALVSQRVPRRQWQPPQVVSVLGCIDLMDRSASFFPVTVPDDTMAGLLPAGTPVAVRGNLSPMARRYLTGMGAANEIALINHCLAVMHAPRYRQENESALRQDWPRIPLPAISATFDRSAILGDEVRMLLDPQLSTVVGQESGYPHKFRELGYLASLDQRALDPLAGDLAVTAGWGIRGKGGITMPSRGRLTDHGESVDVWLNERAYWANVPRPVWEYTLGGYQVIKKWLSYREKALLGRDLKEEEARYVTEMVRRIAAILSLGPALDASYEAVKAEVWGWGEG